MKRTAIILLIMALLLLVTSTVYAAQSPFNGSWRSIDVDGSRQQMKISGGNKGVFKINFVDHSASFCGGRRILGKGRGLIGSGGVLHTDIDFRCLGGLKKKALDVDYRFTYHAANDTLTDTWGVTWNRTRKNKNK